MKDLLAIPLVAILSGLSLLHAYWALGGHWGSDYAVPVVDGGRSFEPSPLATWIVAALLALAVVVVLGRAGWIGAAPLHLWDIGIWGLTLVFFARSIGDLRTFGFLKTVTGTRFATWDTFLYSPLCLVLAALAAGLALTPRADA